MAEALGLRTLVPLEEFTLLSSARRTGRVLAVASDYRS
jgi:pyruvate/2-oxoglutarate/acetoin dehydrogenase E1 component